MAKRELKKGEDFIGVTVVYFCHDGNGKFIMAKRSKNTRDEHGKWDIGGGGIEFGESVAKTLRKEIKEEYCTKVLDYRFLGFRDVHRTHAGRRTHWIALDFNVKIDPKKVKNGEPHKFDDVQWFTLDTIPTNSHSQFHHFLELYSDKLR
ncbi:NUDIX domain-containing protein [Candidatus Microgenomates bacterium]|nr:NUDIX domain-containing protein [Candidatus Microgenomates bacterium]